MRSIGARDIARAVSACDDFANPRVHPAALLRGLAVGRQDSTRPTPRLAALARSRTKTGGSEVEERLRLIVPRDRAREVIETQVAAGHKLAGDADHVTDDESYDVWTSRFEKWRAVTMEALRSIASTDEWRAEFDRATGHIFRQIGQTEHQTFANRQDVIPKGVTRLEGFVERLAFVDAPADHASTTGSDPSTAVAASRKVFVVHGRDEGARETVARLLERLDFEPIILAEQASEGRTLIEKFEDKALEVGFAVVLLSPDDFAVGPERGELPGEPNRARQNVILELGYFMGKLGRSNVAALYKPGAELPSDIHGLVYVRFDGDGWKFELAKELKAAGYAVDFNRLG